MANLQAVSLLIGTEFDRKAMGLVGLLCKKVNMAFLGLHTLPLLCLSDLIVLKDNLG